MNIIIFLIYITLSIIIVSVTLYVLSNTLVLENPFDINYSFHDLEVSKELFFTIGLLGSIPYVHIILFILFGVWYTYHCTNPAKNNRFISKVFNIYGYKYIFKSTDFIKNLISKTK